MNEESYTLEDLPEDIQKECRAFLKKVENAPNRKIFCVHCNAYTEHFYIDNE